jgi:hypothetical protein
VDLEDSYALSRRATYYCLRCLHGLAEDGETRLRDLKLLRSRGECVLFRICSVCKRDGKRVFTAHKPQRSPEL